MIVTNCNMVNVASQLFLGLRHALTWHFYSLGEWTSKQCPKASINEVISEPCQTWQCVVFIQLFSSGADIPNISWVLILRVSHKNYFMDKSPIYPQLIFLILAHISTWWNGYNTKKHGPHIFKPQNSLKLSFANVCDFDSDVLTMNYSLNETLLLLLFYTRQTWEAQSNFCEG